MELNDEEVQMLKELSEQVAYVMERVFTTGILFAYDAGKLKDDPKDVLDSIKVKETTIKVITDIIVQDAEPSEKDLELLDDLVSAIYDNFVRTFDWKSYIAGAEKRIEEIMEELKDEGE